MFLPITLKQLSQKTSSWKNCRETEFSALNENADNVKH